jgi:hypothetical protein
MGRGAGFDLNQDPETPDPEIGEFRPSALGKSLNCHGFVGTIFCRAGV